MQTLVDRQNHKSLKGILLGLFSGIMVLALSGQAWAGYAEAEKVVRSRFQPGADKIYFETPVKFDETKAAFEAQRYNPPFDPAPNDPTDTVPSSLQGDTAIYNDSFEVQVNVCSAGSISTYKIYAIQVVIQAPCFNSQQVPIPLPANSSSDYTITFPKVPQNEVVMINSSARKIGICFSDGCVNLK